MVDVLDMTQPYLLLIVNGVLLITAGSLYTVLASLDANNGFFGQDDAGLKNSVVESANPEAPLGSGLLLGMLAIGAWGEAVVGTLVTLYAVHKDAVDARKVCFKLTGDGLLVVAAKMFLLAWQTAILVFIGALGEAAWKGTVSGEAPGGGDNKAMVVSAGVVYLVYFLLNRFGPVRSLLFKADKADQHGAVGFVLRTAVFGLYVLAVLGVGFGMQHFAVVRGTEVGDDVWAIGIPVLLLVILYVLAWMFISPDALSIVESAVNKLKDKETGENKSRSGEKYSAGVFVAVAPEDRPKRAVKVYRF